LLPQLAAADGTKEVIDVLAKWKADLNQSISSWPYSPIARAVEHNNARVVEALITNGVDIHQQLPYYNNATLVWLAVARGSFPVLQKLFQLGADVFNYNHTKSLQEIAKSFYNKHIAELMIEEINKAIYTQTNNQSTKIAQNKKQILGGSWKIQ
jgi:hypothetical protein